MVMGLLAVSSCQSDSETMSQQRPSSDPVSPSASYESTRVSAASNSSVAGPAVDAGGLPFGEFLEQQLGIGVAVSNAIRSAATECLIRLGYAVEPSVPAVAPSIGVLERRYGLPPREILSATGYSRSEAVQSPAVDPLLKPELQAPLYNGGSDVPGVTVPLLDADGQQIGGVLRSGGCYGEAQEAIFGTFERYARFNQVLSLVEAAASTAYEQTLASPELADLDAKWSACMANAGYIFRTPLDALNADWRLSSDVPSDLEINTALADYDCRNERDYSNQALALEAAFQRQSPLAEQFSSAFDELKAMLEELITK
jgi:hypothetical protein